ncbi:MAG: extracellular solute-binding protein [Eubacteriales bacterium]|nr:extracellular solute-binding protein [Eubacteriales bacterium]
MALISLSGCSQTGSSQAGIPAVGQEAGSTSTETNTSGTVRTAQELYENGIQNYQYAAGEVKKYEEPLTLTFGRNIDLNAENWLQMAEQGEPIENNRWIKYYKDTLNIDCEYSLANASLADYNQELLLAMTSGTLPDVFHVFDQSMISQLAEAGVIWDMTEIYQQNANETLGGIIEGEGTEIYSTGMYDGKLYAIPQKMPSTNSYNHLWVRRDWLNELNLDKPETMDDVKAIAQAFTENYANNVGLLFSNSYMYEYQGIFWAFGGKENKDRNQWVLQEDGTLAYSEILPEMKEGLRWLNSMYEAGLINPEWATMDTWTALADYVATNRCGIFFGPHWYGFSLQSYEDTMDADADWIAVGLPTGIPGQEVLIPSNNTVDGWICVSKNNENPEAVIHMLNAYVEQLFGENNNFSEFFACDLDSSLWKATPVWSLSATVDLEPCENMAENYDASTGTMNEAGLKGAGATYWQYIKDGLSAYQYMFGPADSCFSFVAKTYPQDLLWNQYLGAPTKTQNERWSSMTELIDSYYLKMINGEIDINTGFDQMVKEWNTLGGTQVTAEINEEYAKYRE